MPWDSTTYRQRILSETGRQRHAAGSPTGDELTAYATFCESMDPDSTVLILGMTPELRMMAAQKFQRVVSIDRSPVAIELFSQWMPEELRPRETIIAGCWTELTNHLTCPLAGILGDGIIGNIPGRAETLGFLQQLTTLLEKAGRCIMRNVILPPELDPDEYRFPKLLDAFRAGQIDEAEFGFTSRMLGFHEQAYDRDLEILDNEIVYRKLDAMRAEHLLTDQEWSSIVRYRFGGKNFFPSQSTWELLLAEAGFKNLTTHRLSNKLWHSFYPVQCFTLG